MTEPISSSAPPCTTPAVAEPLFTATSALSGLDRRSYIGSSEVEEWRSVVGYEGCYSVSTRGRVRRDRGAQATQSGRILAHRAGRYPSVNLSRGGRASTLMVHALMLEAFVGPAPEGMQCRHLNGNPTDCRIENLAWGTPAENSGDRVRHGTQACGSRVSLAKLSEEDIPEIRRLAGEGVRHREIAARFNVTRATVSKIAKGEAWCHVG